MLWTLSCNNLPLGHISKDRVLGPELESMETTILSPLLFIVPCYLLWISLKNMANTVTDMIS